MQQSKLSPAQKRKIVEMYEAGDKLAAISADNGGISSKTIYRLIRRAGVRLRTKES